MKKNTDDVTHTATAVSKERCFYDEYVCKYPLPVISEKFLEYIHPYFGSDINFNYNLLDPFAVFNIKNVSETGKNILNIHEKMQQILLNYFIIIYNVTKYFLIIKGLDANKQSNKCNEISGSLKEMVYGLSHMPSLVARCWIVQFCTYFSNFACWVYLTDYFGENIMGGDAIDTNINSTPTEMLARQRYDLGVEYGNLAFMFIAGISAIFSLCASKLVEWFGLKRLWILCLSVYSFVMILSPMIHDLRMALFLFSFIGLPMGASFTLPWSVVSSYSTKKDPNNAGLWLSSLNIAECGPELTMGLLGGIIIDQFKNDVSSVFFIAGIVNLFSVCLVLKVDTSLTEDDDEGTYDFVSTREKDKRCLSPLPIEKDNHELISYECSKDKKIDMLTRALHIFIVYCSDNISLHKSFSV